MFDVENLFERRADNRWERVCAGDLFERNVWSRPDHEALVGMPGAFVDPAYERMTYRQADEAANRFANGLLARGLGRGDRVLLVCENTIEAYIAKIAIGKAGMVVVPVNPSLAEDVIHHLVERCAPRFAMVDAELWPRVGKALAGAGLAVDVTIPIGGEVIEGSISHADFVRDQPTTEPDVTVHGDDIWQILFTSGTTAMPKGVMQSHTYAYFAAYSFALTLTRGIPHEQDLRLCTFLPAIYHVTDLCLTLPAFVCGGTLILGRRPDPHGAAIAVTREGATAYYPGSSQMLRAFAEMVHSDPMAYSARTVKVIPFAWSNIPPGLATMLQDLCGPDVHLFEIFGQTESITCHRFHLERNADKYRRHAPHVNYVGTPSPALASAVWDEEGNDLRDQPGVQGEAVYRSPGITAGYYKDRAATEQAFRGGWFHSGDTCVYDEEGDRVMQDRSKDIVKSGGENVSSLRVEAVLQGHPAVARAAVIGVKHERWGEAVTALVILGGAERGAGPSEAELIAFARQRLAGFELPKKIIFVEDFPVTVGGKVLKYKLRAQYENLYE
jgi:acyl-CoA synthetase (AMP-forming)/AMP-acid ligase II